MSATVYNSCKIVPNDSLDIGGPYSYAEEGASDILIPENEEIIFEVETSEDDISSSLDLDEPATEAETGCISLVNTIEKKKLSDLDIIDNFMAGTIPKIACFTMFLITNVSDGILPRLAIKCCLSLSLTDEALDQHRNKTKTYLLVVRSKMQDSEDSSSASVREFTFEIMQKSGEITCFFDLGFQDDLQEFKSDKVKVHCEVEVKPAFI